MNIHFREIAAAEMISAMPKSKPIVISEPVQFATRVSRMVSIKASHVLSERKSWSDMTILVISGSGILTVEEEVWQLSARETFQIPPHCEHRNEAETNLRMIISFNKSKIF